MKRKLLLHIIFLFVIVVSSFAEGTKSASPNASTITALLSAVDLSNGPYKDCPPDNRIKFYIKDHVNENLYFGFQLRDYTQNATTKIGNGYYRIYNPDGSVALTGKWNTNAGAIGNIDTYNQAVNGPNIGSVTTGYNPIVFNPTMAGEHWIELYQSSDNGDHAVTTADYSSRIAAVLFDFTVAQNSGLFNKIDGRVYSNKWGLYATAPSYSNLATASSQPSIYAYVNQSIVKVAFQSGFEPIAWNVAVNNYGVTTAGTFDVTRKSTNNAIAPSLPSGYNVFLNSPDPEVFPVGSPPAIPNFCTPAVTGCGPYLIHYYLPELADVKLILNLNGVAGFQAGTADRVLEAFDVSAGDNVIAWDGKDGLGNSVASGTNIKMTVVNEKGRYNIPLYDVEMAKNGILVSVIAPVSIPNATLYWDDSQLTNVAGDTGTGNITGSGLNNSFTGTVSPAHAWSGNGNLTQIIPAPSVGTNETNGAQNDDFGNVRTINTWGWAATASSSELSLILGCSDLRVTKSVDNPTPNVGSNVTFTVTAINDGPAPDAAVVTDLLPSGYTFVSASASKGSYDNATEVWTVGNIANGSNETLQIIATVNPSGIYANTATITGGQEDPNLTNNSVTNTPVPVPVTDLSIAKSAPATVIAGQGLTYTLSVTNNGPSVITTANQFKVTDILPAGFTASSYTPSSGTYTSGSGLWTGASIPCGGTVTLTIAGNVSGSATGSLSNTATVELPSGFVDPTPANNISNPAVTTVNREIDLSITKTAAPTVIAGNALTYIITVTNNGPSTIIPADHFTITDVLPAGFIATAFTPSSGTYVSGSGDWTGVTLANGQSVTLTITGTVSGSATGNLSNTASVTVPTGVTDPSPANNTSSTVTTTINRQADLCISKSAPASVVAGEGLSYTITVTNNGPSTILPADEFTVSDALPSGFTASSYTPSQGTYTPGTGAWSGVTMSTGQSVTLIIAGTVNGNATGSLSNVANVTAPLGVTDPTGSNNTSSTVTTNIVRQADFSITKSAPASVVAGGTLTYTITVTNNGSSSIIPSDQFTVTDVLPANFAATSFTASVGSFISGSGVWTGVSLPCGSSVTLTIAGTINASATGSLSNTASVTGPAGVTDSNTGNNTSGVVVTTIDSSTDLSINKSSVASVIAGQTLNYTITVTNNGPSAILPSHHFTVTDILPSGFTATSYTPSAGTYTSGTGDWTGVTLFDGQSVTLTIGGNVNGSATGSLSNIASVSVPTGFTDPTPANNTSSSVVTTINRQADLCISKSAPASVVAGEGLSYTITVTNNGPSTILPADEFMVLDALPSGFTATSYTPSQGTYTEGTGAWSGVKMSTGQSVTLVIAGTVNGNVTGSLSNTASVAAPSGVTDPTGANNTSSAVTTSIVRQADLSITKSAPASVVAGGTLTYTITVTNNGSSSIIPSDQFTVTDVLPASFTATSFTPSVGSYISGTGVWSGVSLPKSGSVVLTISGVVNASATGSLSNSASVTAPTGVTDPVPGNNTSAAVITTIDNLADLAITKSASAASIIAGQALSYTITVTNNGPSTILPGHHFTLTDVLPAGYNATAYIPSAGTYTSGTGDWTGVTLLTGQSVSLTIGGNVSGSVTGSITNTATVSVPAGFSDPTPSNNTATSGTTTINKKADLSISKSSPASIAAGKNLSYVITVTNNGPSSITPSDLFTVIDDLPGGFTATNYTASTGTYDSSTGAWTGVSLPSGGNVTLTIVGKVNAGISGTLDNTAYIISPTGIPDPDNSNNTANVSTATFKQTDLSITKVIDTPNPTIGSTVTFTITAKNNGPSNATGVNVNELLPTGYTLNSISYSKGSWSEPIWNIGSMASGASETMTLIATVNGSGVYANTATISGAQSDTDLSNNSFTATAEPKPIISITNASATEGNTEVFTVGLSLPSSSPVVITPSFSGVTATIGTDTGTPIQYTTDGGSNWITWLSGNISIPAGVTALQIRIPTVDDNIAEPTETFTLTTSVVSGNTTNNNVTGIGTITDNDATTLNLTGFSVTETDGSQTRNFVATLDKAAEKDIVLSFSTANGTALSGSDYTAQSAQTVTIPAGSTSVNIPVEILGDLISEPIETFTGTISVSNANGQNVTLGTLTATATITDNDILNVSINDVSVNENAGTATFTVTLSGATQGLLTVDYSTSDNTALAGTDYTTVSGTVSFPAGSPAGTTKTVTVPILDDNISEPVESFYVNLTNLQTVSTAIISDNQGVGTIIDNDATTLNLTGFSVTETDGSQTRNFVATLDKAAEKDIVLSFSTANGTALSGSDYTAQSAQIVTIPAGSTSVNIPVEILGDLISEPIETFTGTISVSNANGQNVTLGTLTATATITDNDILNVSINDVSVNENAGAATFTVTLSGATQSLLTVDYSTSNNTALSGTDYSTVSGTVSFPAGSPAGTTKTVTVPILDDNISEPVESFYVNLNNLQSSSTAIISDNQGVGTIIDNDATTLNLTGFSVTETDGSQTRNFVATLDKAAEKDIVLSFSTANGTALSGSDYTAQSAQTVTIPAGSTSVNIPVEILGDLISEPIETFTGTISVSNANGQNVTLGTLTATATITDNDILNVSINDVSVNENAGTATFTVTLSGATQGLLTVDYSTSNNTALSGTDYSTVSGTVSFPAGSPAGTTKTVTVPILDDNISEPVESFYVNLNNLQSSSTAVISDNQGVGTIIDNDATTLNLTGFSVTETDGSQTRNFVATLDKAAEKDIVLSFSTANGTALSGSDYTAQSAQTVTIPAGSTSVNIPVEILGDLISEPIETFTGTISVSNANGQNVTLGTLTATATITDNDILNVSINDVSVNENGGTATFTVTLSGATQGLLTVDYSTSNNTALSGTDYSTVSGTVSFPAGSPAGTTKTVTVPILDDNISEPVESFYVNLNNLQSSSTAVISDNQGVGTITDNDAVSHDDNVNTNEDTPVKIDVIANDVYAADNIVTISNVTAPHNGTVAINADKTVSYIPNPDFNGVDTFIYTLNVVFPDNSSTSLNATVTVTVLSVTDTKDDNANTLEDTPVNISVLSNDGFSGTNHAVTGVSAPANGIVVINPDSSITYTPKADFNGTDTFTYTVTVTNADGTKTTETATVTVTVTPVNDAKDDTANTLEDTPVTIPVLSNDNFSGTNHAVTGVSVPTNGTAVINPDGSITYTPKADFNGTDTFTYTVTVTNADGTKTTETATVTVTVTPVNDAKDDTANTDEDTPVTISVLSNDGFSGTNHDVTGVSAPANGIVVINADGTITYTPKSDFNGTDTFTYTVTVTNADGTKTTETATVTVTVTPVNDVKDDTENTDEDTPVTIPVLSNDNFSGTNHAVTGVSVPTNGTAVINADGSITYTPKADFNGTDTFTYTVTVTNADGTKTIETATVTVSVAPVNDIPVGKDIFITTPEDTPISDKITVTDVDGDILVYNKKTDPIHGTAVVNADGTYTYTPNKDYIGNDSFSVTVTDGNGGTIVIVVNISVTPINDPPVAVDDTYTTLEDKALTGNVLSNDNDPENNPISLVKYSVNGVTKNPGTFTNITNIGTIAIVADGSFTFTPVRDYSGTLPPISYVVSDGVLTDTANVKITVLPLPEVYKSSSKPILNNDGTFRWSYTIKLVNDTNQDLDSIQVDDNLDDVFKTKGCSYQVTKIVASGGLTANGLFNGSTNTKTLLNGSALKINRTDSIEIEVKVNTKGQTDSIEVYNQALYEETLYNQSVSILSDDISTPAAQDPTRTVIPEVSLFIPDAFSPNEDTINDKFVIIHPSQSKIEFEVYNRWDNKVYASKDYKNDWDGKGTGSFLGRELPNGTYYCVYKVINTVTGAFMTKGVKYITLRR